MNWDVALGFQNQDDDNKSLREFAKSVGASFMAEWSGVYYEEGEFEGWGGAFRRVMDMTLENEGHIYFNLTGLNIGEALAGDSSHWVERYTAWELQQIVNDAKLFAITSFYNNGQKLTLEQVAGLGISSQHSN